MPTNTSSAKAANAKILAYLQSGRELTTKQARTRFKISNVSARIAELRNAGFSIYCNAKRRGAVTTYAYRLGNPTRRTVAAGQLVQRDQTLKTALGPVIDRNLALV